MHRKEFVSFYEYQKILILYFSVFHSADKFTEKFAKLIAEQTGGDLIEIQSVKEYPDEYKPLEALAKEEQDADERPDIKNKIDISGYDTIFIGYPIWWYTLPQILFTLFDKYDFSGKTIIPFNTHEGGRDAGTYETIQKLEPNAKVLEGLPIRGMDMNKDQSKTVRKWLDKLGF